VRRCVISGERNPPESEDFGSEPLQSAGHGSGIATAASHRRRNGDDPIRKCEFCPAEITMNGTKRRFAIQEPDRDAEDARVARVAKDRNFNSRQAD